MPKQTLKKPLSQIISQSKRNDKWLITRLNSLWESYFGNVSVENPVFIRFGRYSRFRLGSIRLDRYSKSSFITVTGMFKDPTIPVEVVDHTIAHELCHYAHGFSSTKPRLHKFPHHGGIIKKELESRGMHKLVKAYAVWLDEYRKTLD
jgi:hypothetical protein